MVGRRIRVGVVRFDQKSYLLPCTRYESRLRRTKEDNKTINLH